MRQIPISYNCYVSDIPASVRPSIFKLCRDYGVNYLNLSSNLMRDMLQNPALANDVHAETEAAGIKFTTAHAPFGPLEDLNVPSPRYRSMMLDRLRLVMRLAADFNVTTIVIHTGNLPPLFKEYPLETMHQMLIDSLKELMPLAEELNLIVAIENIWTPANTPERLIDAHEKVNSPQLGFCFDSGHANLMASQRDYPETTPTRYWEPHGPVPWDTEILEKLLPNIVTCHLQDNHGQNDEHLPPGDGNINWQHVATLLQKAPRLKTIECEVNALGKGVTIASLCHSMTQILGDCNHFTIG